MTLKSRLFNTKKLYPVLAALFILILFLLPNILGDPYYIRLVQMIAIFSLLSLGLNFLFGYTGQISLGHAAFYAFGAYISSVLETKFNVYFIFAWIIALTVTAIVAFLISFPILKLKGHYLAMATLAFGLIIELILIQWLPITGGHDGITIDRNDILGNWFSEKIYYFIVGSAILVFLLLRNITKSSVGRALQAIRDDEDAAEALGISIKKHKVYAFVVSAVIAALAGIWYVHLSRVITPEVFSLHTSISVLMMVVVGGLASHYGAVFGASLFVILPEFLYDFQEANILVFGTIVLIVLVFFPRGIIGLFETFVKLMKFNFFSSKLSATKGDKMNVS